MLKNFGNTEIEAQFPQLDTAFRAPDPHKTTSGNIIYFLLSPSSPKRGALALEKPVHLE